MNAFESTQLTILKFEYQKKNEKTLIEIKIFLQMALL